jgi:hypothetical protein
MGEAGDEDEPHAATANGARRRRSDEVRMPRA